MAWLIHVHGCGYLWVQLRLLCTDQVSLVMQYEVGSALILELNYNMKGQLPTQKVFEYVVSSMTRKFRHTAGKSVLAELTC